MREAKLLGSTAALERFDAYPGRGVTQDRIDRLATCEWIDYGKDLIIVGATGTGKSFLAQALAVAACRKKLTARYFRLNDLANDFDAAAEHPQARKQLLADLQAPALAVIDDFLATDVSAHALNQVFNLLVGREHASTVIASQHEPDYWYDVFSEAALADAVMSRLANHGSKLTLTGEDMRTRDDIKHERMAPTTPTRLRQPRKP
ncbi:DNA replication protein DnaC [Corynebacterium mucifaciens]